MATRATSPGALAPSQLQPIAPPSVSLPKGGGAIRGIGETFSANAVTGTGSLSVRLATSPGRAGFGPSLALSYDSGAGNGPFGVGWSLSLPAITRRTERGLPQYRDADDSDVFQLAGDDLVPVLSPHVDGTWARDTRTRRAVGQIFYEVERYRPRTEGPFTFIERWVGAHDPSDCFWRTISRDGVTSWFGRSSNSRIVDPADAQRVFAWLLSESHDDQGNAIAYEYAAENSANVPTTAACERNRSPESRGVQRYVQKIRYGNRSPYLPQLDPDAPWPALPAADQWLFEVVFDYGEGYVATVSAPAEEPVLVSFTASAAPAWPMRADPFSSYRAGFEVRTYRLCRRVLMVHHFPDELGTADALVQSTTFAYREAPAGSFLQSVVQSGYVRLTDGRYLEQALPPLDFEYSIAQPDAVLREVPAEARENLPIGFDGAAYQWVDLDGEGLAGLLSAQPGGWWYKRNLSPLRLDADLATPAPTARFAALESVSALPGVAGKTAGTPTQLLDLDGDGRLEAVELQGTTPGFYSRTAAETWTAFQPFASLPNLRWRDPNLRFVDLTGDARPDVLVTEHEVFTVHRALGERGFAAADPVRTGADEERGPRVIFADATESLYVADMSGDGLADLVRVRNGEVCYWPNLGYGRFGAKVAMDDAPWFDTPDQFDQRRLRLADVDGFGTTDLIYLGREATTLFHNESGNRFAAGVRLPAFPPTDDLAAVHAIDLLGNGTVCLVWSSPLPGHAHAPMRYLDLMGGVKPHLLTGTRNHLGGSTQIEYAPSTKFYLADKAAGHPWITKLPFPVQVVERITRHDAWRQSTITTTYSYHHGYFDGEEREFRGFGRVEQIDTEDFGRFAAQNAGSPYVTSDQRLYQPPVKTITWFHTGVGIDRARVFTQYEREYFPQSVAARPASVALDAVFQEKRGSESPLDPALTSDEWREALRACRGMMLRQEIYELDLSALHPAGPASPPREIAVRLFSAASHRPRVLRIQPRGGNPHAVFLGTRDETMTYGYELDLRTAATAGSTSAPPLRPDPRITHELILSFNRYGEPQQTVTVAYARRRPFDAPQFVDETDGDAQTAAIRRMQSETVALYREDRFTDDAIDTPPAPQPVQYHRLGQPCERTVHELTGFSPASGAYFEAADFLRYALSDTLPNPGAVAVTRNAYHQLSDGATPTLRLIEHRRTVFFADDPAAPARFLREPLPLGQLGRLGFVYEQYQLALTAPLLETVFANGQLSDTLPAGGTVRAALGERATSGYLADAAATALFGIDAAGEYWIRSGSTGFSLDAAQHFYRAERYTDAFGQVSVSDFDARDLFIASSTDAAGNRSRVTRFDYRVLAPAEIEDANGNRSAVAFDALGRVTATAELGKGAGADDLTGFDALRANPTTPERLQLFAPPVLSPEAAATRGRAVLGNATARVLYDFGGTRDLQGKWQWEVRPAAACTIVREQRAAAVAARRQTDPGATTPVQIAFERSDGSGALLLRLAQAEPEAAGGPLRWIVSGKTVVNNKGNPVKQYEPYFTAWPNPGVEPASHEERGVTPLLFYDAPGRLIRTALPDGASALVTFTPWHVLNFDANDTAYDADPTRRSDWYRRRKDPAHPRFAEYDQPAQARAAESVEPHAGTPTLTLLDALGRPAITVTHNRVPSSAGGWRDERHLTFTKLDAEGKALWLRDARGNLVVQSLTRLKPTRAQDEPDPGRVEAFPANAAPGFDLAGNLLYQHSMDAGDRWTLCDASGRALFAWDVNDRQGTGTAFTAEQRFHATEYDHLRRPVIHWLRVNQAAAQAVERFEYRDALTAAGAPNPQLTADRTANRLGQLFRQYDPSGRVEILRRDLAGRVLEVARRLNRSPTASVVDWQGNLPAKLQAETFRQITAYDALGRMALRYNWHRDAARVAVYEPGYNERGLLRSERLRVRAQRTAQGPVGGTDPSESGGVSEIRYNARGQKLSLALANGTLTEYDYEPETFRLWQIFTTRPADPRSYPQRRSNLQDARVVQELNLTYDPIGNITQSDDQAYRPVFFDGGLAAPATLYRYDALYRLSWASGRETAQGGQSARDGRESAIAAGFPITGQTLRRYEQNWGYDAAGNVVRVQHVVPQDTASGWTRNFAPASDSNRVARTWTGTAAWDVTAVANRITFAFDRHGNQLNRSSAGALFNLRWDHRDLLHRVNLGGGGEVAYQYDAARQRTRKTITRGPADSASRTIREERIAFEGYELYRRSTDDATDPVEEIESHHLSVGGERVLLVDDVWRTRSPRPDGGSLRAQIFFRYQYANHLGSACLELGRGAEILSYEEYHPYGTTAYRAADGAREAPAKRYRYTGRERDEETGLGYHGARYYAAGLARWISADPSGVAAGPNVYAYVKGNPVSFLDPNGRQEARPQDDKWSWEYYRSMFTAEGWSEYMKGYMPYLNELERQQSAWDARAERLEKQWDQETGMTGWYWYVYKQNYIKDAIGPRPSNIWAKVAAIYVQQLLLNKAAEFKAPPPARLIHRTTTELEQILNSERIVARTEGAVYAAEESALLTGRAAAGNRVVFQGEALSVFKPHSSFGFRGWVKRMFGEYKAGIGDLRIDRATATLEGNTLYVRKATLVSGLQSKFVSYAQLTFTKVILEPISFVVPASGALLGMAWHQSSQNNSGKTATLLNAPEPELASPTGYLPNVAPQRFHLLPENPFE